MKTLWEGIWRDFDEEARAEERKRTEVRKASEYLVRAEIGRVCVRLELEPDEFYTLTGKARRELES